MSDDDLPPGPELAAPVELDGHLPRRPTWNCRCCGEPWPCTTAREQLAEAMSRTYLITFMAGLRGDAIIESDRSPAEISDRFIGWIR